MLRLILSAILSACVCTLSFAGETAFTSIKTTSLMGGALVQIDAEGTNELKAGESYNGWAAVFVRPDLTTVTAYIIEFDSSKIKAGAGPQVFKIRYTCTDPNGKDKGNWKARSQLLYNMTSHTKDSNTVAVP